MAARNDAVNLNGTGPPSGALAATTSSSRTPTQERPNPIASSSAGQDALSSNAGTISARRGSDSLSIGIPGSSRQRPMLAATAGAANGTNGSALSNEATPIPSPSISTNPATTTARPPIARQKAKTGNETDDDGYEGEREQETEVEIEASPVTAGTDAAPNPLAQRPHSPSAESTASSNATYTPGPSKEQAQAKPQTNGHQVNGHDHEYDDNYVPYRRNHHRSSTVSSIGSNSSKRDPKENMKPFPTPGIKEERNPFEEEKSIEECRLDDAESKAKHWKRWGPYLSERQWVSEARPGLSARY